MKTRTIAAIVGAIISVHTLYGNDAVAAPRGALTILLYAYAGLPHGVSHNLPTQTSEIMSRSGIWTEWVRCTGLGASRAEVCSSKLEPGQIILRIVARCSEEDSKRGEVLGFAINRSSYISLCADQVIQVEKDKFLYPGSLMPYAAAHEIGHLLLGPEHGTQGVMRGMWRKTELSALQQRKLAFTAAEGELMRKAVSRTLAATLPPLASGRATVTVGPISH
jgi:hypothetical protein